MLSWINWRENPPFRVFFGGAPSVEPTLPPVPPPPPPLVDEEEQRRLALQRRSIEAKRAGRGALVIAPSQTAGLSQTGVGGLRITRP